MIQLLKKNIKIKNEIFFQSSIGTIRIFFVDKIIKIPTNVKVDIQDQTIYFEGLLGKLSLTCMNEILFFYKKNQLIFILNTQKNKKSILNLYNKLIKIKIKGVLQGYKLNLILQGIGFKAFIEKNVLTLKLGFSHPISIPIPSNIKMISQSNHLICSSIDYIFLTQFVHLIKSYKKPEPYKGKGLLLKNEKIIKKEGKKSKK
jgi:large subunit ribosomal protein L6